MNDTRTEILSASKYVCVLEDLDKLLNDDLKAEFHGLFYSSGQEEGQQVARHEAWRMFHGAESPEAFLQTFGIDFEQPRVRDAVAFDLVKLDDGSVSNTHFYSYPEHVGYSPLEYERWLLNKNFRIHMVNLQPAWKRIRYRNLPEDDNIKAKRMMDKMFQGLRLSPRLLRFLVNPDGTPPSTGPEDLTLEFSLVPNVSEDFQSLTSRAYYDTKYLEYKRQLKELGISAISTFALVDEKLDKNHTGRYLLKVQCPTSAGYNYVVATIGEDGQLDGIELFYSTDNTILCVCADDFKKTRTASNSTDVWTPEEREVPMVKSTTSSRYSIFEQRVPNYDLKQVRHYLQFKNRLVGMELSLSHLDKNIKLKEVQASKCFLEEAKALSELFQEFGSNKALMELVMQYYDCVARFDQLFTKKTQLEGFRDEKMDMLDELRREYDKLDDKELDKKLELGQKIGTLRLELDKKLNVAIANLEQQIAEVKQQVCGINKDVCSMQGTEHVEPEDDELEVLSSIDVSKLQDLVRQTERWRNFMLNLGHELLQLRKTRTPCEDQTIKVRRLLHNFEERMRLTEEQVWDENHEMRQGFSFKDISVAGLRDMVLLHDWYASNAPGKTWDEMGFQDEDEFMEFRRRCNKIAYNLRKNQYAQMLQMSKTRIDDRLRELSTIMGNKGYLKYRDKYGEEAGRDSGDSEKPWSVDDVTQEQVERIRPYAEAESRAVYADDAEGSRTEANKIQREKADRLGMFARIEERFVATRDSVSASSEMHRRQKEQADRIRTYVKADRKLGIMKAAKADYKRDFKLMKQRVLNHLKNLGLAEDENGLEALALRNKIANFQGNVSEELGKLENGKKMLDQSKELMLKQRSSIQTILDDVVSAEERIRQLETANKRIFQACLTERDRRTRNNLLLAKLDNESQIAELKSTVKNVREKHLTDFSNLEQLRADVDNKQREYDQAVDRFKETVGLDDDAVYNLTVGIYNRYQDEILEGE